MKKIYLIDWNNFIYRMFFWLPEFSTKDGKIVNAIFWMAKFFVWQLCEEKPDYIYFIRDAKGKNFRHDLYKEYKATRDRMPDNLRVQVDDIEHMIELMWVPIISIEWYEADDVIGTFAERFDWDSNYEVDILTWDKDLYSLVSNNIKIYDTMKKRKFGPEETKEKFWVEPKMIIDYLAIVWDKSDNIPWIDWFWPKKAIELINQIGWVEEIYIEVDNIENGTKSFNDFDKSIQSCFKWKTYEKLLYSRDDAFLSKKLASIHKEIDLNWFELDKHIFDADKIKNDQVIELFKNYEFNSLIWEEEIKLETWNDTSLKVQCITNDKQLNELKILIDTFPHLTLDTETTSLNTISAELLWISIYLDDNNIFYINKWHAWEKVSDSNLKQFLEYLMNTNITIVWHNLKYDLEILENYLHSSKENISSENGSQMSLI